MCASIEHKWLLHILGLKVGLYFDKYVTDIIWES